MKQISEQQGTMIYRVLSTFGGHIRACCAGILQSGQRGRCQIRKCGPLRRGRKDQVVEGKYVLPTSPTPLQSPDSTTTT